MVFLFTIAPAEGRSRSCGEQDADLAVGMTRLWFYLQHCRVSRNHVAIETSARHPPAVAGGPSGQQDAPLVLFATLPRHTRPLPGRDDAPWVLFETSFATPAITLRLKHQRGLAAGTARQRAWRRARRAPSFISNTVRDTRIFVAHSATARCPPAVAGGPSGRHDAPLVLFATLSATHAAPAGAG